MGGKIRIDNIAANIAQFRVGGKIHVGGAGRFQVQLTIMMRATTGSPSSRLEKARNL